MIRYALRSLGRNPVFTTVAVLSLALALALCTTMFALVDGVTHPRVLYAQPDRLFGVAGGVSGAKVTMQQQYDVYRDAGESVAVPTSYSWVSGTLQVGLRTEDTWVTAVAPNYFALLGVRPEFGRALGAGDASASAQVAVISHALWVRLFGQRPVSSGMTFIAGRSSFTVVGIMPRGMEWLGAGIWIPEAAARSVGERIIGPRLVFRLKPGATRAQLDAKLGLAAAQLTAAYGRRGHGISAWTQSMIPRPARVADLYNGLVMRILVAVLLIACANLGTMMLARGLARRREVAMRMAIGAGRVAIMRLVFTESGVIVAAGALLGLFTTLWAIQVAVHYASPFVPALGDVDPLPSWRVFAFVLGLSAVTLFISTALPAWRASSVDPAEPIKESAGTTTGRNRDRYNPLVIMEVAVSTGLLMAAALLAISATRLTAFDFRYHAKQLLVSYVFAPVAKATDVGPFFDAVVERTSTMRGVLSASTRVKETPDANVVQSEEGRSGERWMNVDTLFSVSPGYLRTLGIPVVQGRDFEPGDRGSSSGVVIVDDSAARKLFPDVPNPVGHMVKFGDERSRRSWLRVIGVARYTEMMPRQDPDLPQPPAIYVVYGQDTTTMRELVVRGASATDSGRASLAIDLHRELRSFVPAKSLFGAQPWLMVYEQKRAANVFLASVFAAFAVFALTLCAVGFYGVLAYTVSRRLREFAVRIALGAQRPVLIRTVVHEAAVMVLAGIGIGAFIALAATRAIADSLYAVHYADVIALLTAEILLVVVGIIGSYGPVRQALAANPVDILRAS